MKFLRKTKFFDNFSKFIIQRIFKKYDQIGIRNFLIIMPFLLQLISLYLYILIKLLNLSYFYFLYEIILFLIFLLIYIIFREMHGFIKYQYQTVIDNYIFLIEKNKKNKNKNQFEKVETVNLVYEFITKYIVYSKIENKTLDNSQGLKVLARFFYFQFLQMKFSPIYLETTIINKKINISYFFFVFILIFIEIIC